MTKTAQNLLRKVPVEEKTREGQLWKGKFNDRNFAWSSCSRCCTRLAVVIYRFAVSALDMLQDEESQQRVITFSERLDELLGGGVPVTKVTEFCGAPGVGKTQMW